MKQNRKQARTRLNRKQGQEQVQGQEQRDPMVLVSGVIGLGEEAHRIVKVGLWELKAMGANGTEPMIPDDVLMERIRYPSGIGKLRQRIRSLHAQNGEKFNPLAVLTERVKTGGRPGTGFLLTAQQAMFLVSQINTPEAREATHEMVRVWDLARRHLLPSQHQDIELREVLAEIAQSNKNITSSIAQQAITSQQILVLLQAMQQMMQQQAMTGGSIKLEDMERLRDLLGNGAQRSAAKEIDDVVLRKAVILQLRSMIAEIILLRTGHLRPAPSRPRKVPEDEKEVWRRYEATRRSVSLILHRTVRGFAGYTERGQSLENYPVGDPCEKAFLFLTQELEKARVDATKHHTEAPITSIRQGELFDQSGQPRVRPAAN